MTFEMSLKALIEEELIEAKCILEQCSEQIEKVVNDIRTNEALDHKNDKIRLEIRKFLHSALRAYNMRDYEGMNNDIHAVIQKLQDQEQLDLEDDHPRVDAVLTLSKLQSFAEKSGERIRSFLGKLNEEVTKP